MDRLRTRLNWAALIVIALFLAVPVQRVTAEIISGMVNARTLPSVIADGTRTQARYGRYGELFSIPLTPGTYGLADEGTYWHSMTNTPGTAYNFAGATQTAWVATTPTFVVKNNATPGTTRLYLDYFRMVFATGGTAGTRIEGAVITDTGTRYSSGGTALTAYNDSYDSGASSISTNLFAGAITATAATTPRYLCRFTLKTAIAIPGDAMLVNFGTITASAVSASTAPIAACPPVVIGGGQSLLIYTWQPSQSATPTGEIDTGWWER